jgi:hypothetical protein
MRPPGRFGSRLGMTASPSAGTRRALRWVGPVQSMGSLAPDVELRSAERAVWIDARNRHERSSLGQAHPRFRAFRLSQPRA